ncbi:WD40 repeat domain-containing protein [Actinomadura sp. DC4]|uniref:WD40 repeat domain-containing protein n=1 Tax=Actinomadura sp. DC4 TaxID=3055069 RepID=UPI0025B22A2A|nr:WD40 repeat domain-containing protein [Actinomadura sp. DC4]MDN3359937.1 WD40 repeat domain-containing protein [Actinomadura sp. DC4]
MAAAGAVQIAYRSGAAAGPLGRFALTVGPDGGARLEHRGVTGLRVWTARIERAVWSRLADDLERSGFPAIEPAPVPPGDPLRELTVEPLGALSFGWDDPALGAVFRVLDALVRQVGGGALRSTADELPDLVHDRAREAEVAEPASVESGAAAFGTVEGRPAAVVVGDEVRIFALPDRTPLGAAIPGRTPARAAALGRDLLATAGDDRVIRVRDARTGEVLHARTGPGAPVAGVAAAEAGGRALVLAAAGGEVRLWAGGDAADLGARSVYDGALTSVRHARVGDRDLICAGGDDGNVRLWDAEGGPATTLRGHTGWVNAVALTGDTVASGGADRVVRLWDPVGGGERHALTGHTGSVTGVALSPGGLVASCSLDGTVRTWDAATGEPLAVRPADSGWLTDVAFVRTGEGPAVVTAGEDGSVRLWEAVSGAPIATLTSGSVPTGVATTTAGGRWVVAAGHKDGSLRVWNDGTLARTIPGTDGAVTSVAFGPGGLISGTDDGTVRVHDVGDGRELQVLTPHTAPVLALALDGDLLVSGGADGAVRTWDAPSGAPLARLRGHLAGVTAVATGRTGERVVIASAGYDRVVRTWDAATGGPLLAIHGHTHPVFALAFGEGLLASASYDGVVRVWEPATGAQVALLPGNDGPVRAMRFEGNSLAVATEDGTVRVWRLPEGELTDEAKVAQTPLAVSFSEGRPWVAGDQGPEPV